MKDWLVYILECRDGTFYTGITGDIRNRVTAHNEGRGAKYTKGRGPVLLLYSEKVQGRSEALKREMEIKKMSRSEKMGLMGILNKKVVES